MNIYELYIVIMLSSLTYNHALGILDMEGHVNVMLMSCTET